MGKPLALIVEDDLQIARVYRMALQEAGFEIESVQSGQDALDRLAEAVPNLVILDLRLPNVSGPEVLRQIRGDERLAGIHVIVVTANPQMTEGLDALADLILIKPVSYRQLLDLGKHLAADDDPQP